MKRPFNFSAGPAILPDEVLAEIKAELTSWRMGSSVMELSHRSSYFKELASESTNDVRELLAIPDNYQILFLQGGARLQFSMVPLNLLNKTDNIDYLVTGLWSYLSYEEAKKFAKVNLVADSFSNNDNKYYIPQQNSWQLSDDAKYLYYTPNETITGVEFSTHPKVDKLLIADCSSNLFTKEIDINKYALIFACAQKNFGIAGLTMVIVREDLILDNQNIPSMLNYKNHITSNSLYNTAPVFAWYVSAKMFKWTKAQGGVKFFQEQNQSRSEKLYNYIDDSDYYVNRVAKENRSKVNVTFNLPSAELEKEFILKASKKNLTNLAGHRTLGGIRASIYNAMPDKGVTELIAFMQEFKSSN